MRTQAGRGTADTEAGGRTRISLLCIPPVELENLQASLPCYLRPALVESFLV